MNIIGRAGCCQSRMDEGRSLSAGSLFPTVPLSLSSTSSEVVSLFVSRVRVRVYVYVSRRRPRFLLLFIILSFFSYHDQHSVFSIIFSLLCFAIVSCCRPRHCHRHYHVFFIVLLLLLLLHHKQHYISNISITLFRTICFSIGEREKKLIVGGGLKRTGQDVRHRHVDVLYCGVVSPSVELTAFFVHHGVRVGRGK